MVTMDTSSRIVSVLLGNGGAQFVAGIEYPIAFNASAMRLADFNGDGRADLLVTNNYQTVSVRLNQGNGTFFPSIDYTASFEAGSTLKPAVVADVKPNGSAGGDCRL